jgi:homospermidine synthase
VLPLILRHIGIRPEPRRHRHRRGSRSRRGREIRHRFIKEPLTRENYRRVLENAAGSRRFPHELSVDVSSIALVKFCWERGAMYLDTCIEPWAGGYTDPARRRKRTNYALREDALAAAHRPHGEESHRGAHARRQPRHRVALREAKRCSTSPATSASR